MFGLSGEHLLILAGVLLIFGPRRLPELGASVGKAMRNFKEGFSNPPTNTAQIEQRDPAAQLKAPEVAVAKTPPSPQA
jgi:sec-independent protein translocase protein TatA